MDNLVSVVRVESFSKEGIKKAAYQAIDLIGVNLSGVRSVVIKPNLRWYWDYSTGETTDPRVVSAIIDYVRERWNSGADIKIVESDASAMRTKYGFRILGYEKIAREKSVELFNLSEDEVYEKEVTVGGNRFTLPLPSTLFNSDVLINIPKLKVGPYAGGQCLHMTCALKNLFGCIAKPRKVEYHSRLKEVIVGVTKIVKPHLTVVDGVFGLGKHPIKLGLIIAGKDNLSVEFVAAKVMGYNPNGIDLIDLASKEGVGNIKDVKVVGESLDNARKHFPKRSRLRFKLSWDLQLSSLRLYAKVSGDIIPPVLERN